MKKDYKFLANSIKDKVSIFRVLDYYKIPYRNENFPHNISCPVILEGHSSSYDSHPSCRVFPDTNSVNCFTCRFNGGVIDIVKHRENKTFKEAVDFILEVFDISIQDFTKFKHNIVKALTVKDGKVKDANLFYKVLFDSRKKIDSLISKLLPEREPLAYHLRTRYFDLEVFIDGIITSLNRKEKTEVSPGSLYLEFISSCEKFIERWVSKFPEEDPSFLFNELISDFVAVPTHWVFNVGVCNDVCLGLDEVF